LADSGKIAAPDLAQARADLGLDRPFLVQYWDWMRGALTGDLGRSLFSHKPIGELVLGALPVTLELTVMAVLLALTVALPLGLISAVGRDRLPDLLARLFSISFLSVPDFWTGTVVLLVLSLVFRWIPPAAYVSPQVDLAGNLQQFLLPAAILGLRVSASLTRILRSSMLEVLGEDYLRTAYAKGLSQRLVLTRHALKNALIPPITLLGTQIGYLLGGSVIVETIFNLPGLGNLTVNAVTTRDYTVVQANLFLMALAITTTNLFIDLLYPLLDRRVRLSS
jgi:peptide/nickel transport system permease protein